MPSLINSHKALISKAVTYTTSKLDPNLTILNIHCADIYQGTLYMPFHLHSAAIQAASLT